MWQVDGVGGSTLVDHIASEAGQSAQVVASWGARAAWARDCGTISLKDPRGGGTAHILPGRGMRKVAGGDDPREVTCLSASPDGRFIQASRTGNVVDVYDGRATRQPLCTLSHGRPARIVTEEYGEEMRAPVYDSSRGEMRALHFNADADVNSANFFSAGYVTKGDQGVNSAAWYNNSPRLISVAGNGSVGLWDVSLGSPRVGWVPPFSPGGEGREGESLNDVLKHLRAANTVAVAPDDACAVSGGDDQKLILYGDTALLGGQAAGLGQGLALPGL
mmetsp:Transcript_57029/g.180518  ORF Transcript_57029/g.180518 Transcript_57029/m.180518 type:complete len:276 (-) Transcript_57029:205-1032(-)